MTIYRGNHAFCWLDTGSLSETSSLPYGSIKSSGLRGPLTQKSAISGLFNLLFLNYTVLLFSFFLSASAPVPVLDLN